jgi:hypothetical protein
MSRRVSGNDGCRDAADFLNGCGIDRHSTAGDARSAAGRKTS